MSKYLGNAVIFILLTISFGALAQVDISGRVLDAADSKPIPGATVFLNGATMGTITNKEGYFTLPNVRKGQYDLVLSCIGYTTQYQKVIVANTTLNLPVIKLIAKVTELQEVKINPNRDEYLKMFIRELLGRSASAGQCSILNPDVISVYFSNQTNTLTANTDDYLLIENKATGYKIYYQVNKFSKNYTTNLLNYQGPVHFEELEGKTSARKKWAKAREAIYKGSSMHFLRSVFQADFNEEGFKVYKMIRKPNPNRPPDSLLRVRIKQYSVNTKGHPDWRDSVSFYKSKMRLPKFVDQLISRPLAESDFALPTDNKQLMQLQFKDNLYVVYVKKPKPTVDINNLQNLFFDTSGTIISLINKQALFDSNGILANPFDTLFDGAWSLSGVADMLPINYKP